jgi:hypothetical protein
MLGYPWVAHTLSQCSFLEEWWGIVQPLQSLSYVGLPDPINLACGQYIIKYLFKGPLRMVLTGGGYHLGASNIHIPLLILPI